MRRLRPIPVSVASVLFASAVALGTGGHYWGTDLIFCDRATRSGVNINHAFALTLCAGPVASVLILLTRKLRRLLTVVLVLAATALVVAIALVAVDGAMYVAERTCGFMTVSSVARFHDHVEFLYGLWGLPLGFLVWAVVALWVRPGKAENQRWAWDRQSDG
jgi:hypothetical protein